MGLRKSPPWTEQQKELEGKGYKFNEKGECTHDPTQGELPLPAGVTSAPQRQVMLEKSSPGELPDSQAKKAGKGQKKGPPAKKKSIFQKLKPKKRGK